MKLSLRKRVKFFITSHQFLHQFSIQTILVESRVCLRCLVVSGVQFHLGTLVFSASRSPAAGWRFQEQPYTLKNIRSQFKKLKLKKRMSIFASKNISATFFCTSSLYWTSLVSHDEALFEMYSRLSN